MFMIGLKNVILISAISLVLSSCVTANKCNDKFPDRLLTSDTLTTSKVEDVLLGNILVNLGDVDLSLETPNLDIRFIRDTVIVNTNDTLIITNTIKGGQQSIKCETVKLESIIKGLNVKIRSYETLVTNTKQLYVDVKAENRKLKILTKENVHNAKANKNKALSKIFMWIFLSIALITLAFSIFKFKRK